MRVRPYTASEDAAIVALSRASAEFDPTLRPLTLEGWREFVARPEHAGGAGFAVVEDDAQALVGFAYSARIEDDPPLRHFRIFVNPRARRRGAGTALLRHVAGLDPPASVVAQCICRDAWEAGAAFLRRHGFLAHATSLEMERDGGPPGDERVAGFRLRPYRGTGPDDTAWIALSEQGYRGTPGYTPATPASLAHERARKGFHLWLAEREDAPGEVVGLCMTVRPEGEPARLESVVVAPEVRGRGLGRALTVAGLRTLAGGRVALNVRGDNEPALRVYRGLGFRAVDSETTWRRSAQAGGGP